MTIPEPVPLAPTFFELGGEYISPQTHGGQRTWNVRARNFVTTVTWAAAGEHLPVTDEPDEQILLVTDSAVVVTAAGRRVTATGPALVIAPPGRVEVEVTRPGYLLRVFTARGAVAADAVNASTTMTVDPAVFPAAPSPLGLRVHDLDGIEEVPGRLGRIFRTDALMVNVFAPQDGPRDTDELSPHAHDDFEQASVTLLGDYVHHIRRPWTKRMRDWRPDEHVQVMSPSVTLIPAGNIHTTRAIGHGLHQLVDVFAPPRADFIARGWVLNQSDYGDSPSSRTGE